MRPPRDVRRPHPRQVPAHAGGWVPGCAPRRRGLPEDDERRGLGPLLPGRGRSIGGVLERSFDQFRIVEDAEHWRSIAEISLCVPLPTGEGGRVRVHEPKRLRPLPQEAVKGGGLAGAFCTGEEHEMETVMTAAPRLRLTLKAPRLAC